MKNKIKAALLLRFSFGRNSPLSKFWRWWSGELIALTPQWLRQSAGSGGNVLLVEIGQQAIVMRRWLQGTLTEQGRLDLKPDAHASNGITFQALFTSLHKRGERVALWLSGGQFLSKQIDLPLAAAENLDQVLGFEMDRHTPFKAEQVYFDFRELRRNNNLLSVRLVAAPRQAVDGALQLLTDWGAAIQAVYVADTTISDDDPFDLMPTQRRAAKPPRQRWVKLVVLPLTLILALAAMGIPIWQKRDVVISMMPIVERAKSQANATETLRHAQEKLTAEYNFMLDKKQEIPPVVALLDELSRLLPDDTWVHQFSLKGKELQIQGETASSSKLIALIENSKFLHNANFRAPLTKGYKPNSERYHLAADVKALPAAQLTALAPEQAAVAQPLPTAGNVDSGKSDSAAAKSGQTDPQPVPPQPVAPGAGKQAPATPAGKLEATKLNPQSPPPPLSPAAATKLEPSVPNAPAKPVEKVSQRPEAKR